MHYIWPIVSPWMGCVAVVGWGWEVVGLDRVRSDVVLYLPLVLVDGRDYIKYSACTEYEQNTIHSLKLDIKKV